MEPSTLWGLIISAVLAIGTIAGVILSGVGKKGDQEQQQVTDQFKRMLDEVGYWQATATRTRDEWEKRWDRQMDRCKRTTDKLVEFVTAASALDPAVRARGESLLREVRDHNSTDHDENGGGSSFRDPGDNA